MNPLKNHLFILIFLFFPAVLPAVPLPGPLVTPVWVKENLSRIRIIDVRSHTKSFYEKPVLTKNDKGELEIKNPGGHIKGAALLNFKDARSSRNIDGKKVQKLIPEPADFQNLIESLGINKNDTIVIVSEGEEDEHMTTAARIYWQLKYYGEQNMAILDGGMMSWLSNLYPVSTEKESPRKGNWTVIKENHDILAKTEEVERALKNNQIQIIDNRPSLQYYGIDRKSYVYKAGHIPGASLLPPSEMFSAGLPVKFLDPKEMKKILSRRNISTEKESILYCNSGQLASGGWFVLSEILGNKNVKLYDGSMHEWTLENKPVNAFMH